MRDPLIGKSFRLTPSGPRYVVFRGQGAVYRCSYRSPVGRMQYRDLPRERIETALENA
ncbi:hypothetical protein [Rathayibacter sp. AY2B9]|uniref:hypothetical protein n=1 Tax=Rathayibacter sp. AY2B9 TaxID=2080572 RepID=UPI0015E3496D|nr:hypothetical protein [Rathayibacter sp. AY2B9]